LNTRTTADTPLTGAPDGAAPSGAPSPRARRTKARVERAPYRDDLAYLQDELDWIEARARRIAAQVKLAKFGMDDPPVLLRPRHARQPEVTPESLRRSAQLAGQREEAARRRIDARLARQRRGGSALALDRLCASAGLDDTERTMLLLAAGPCFSRQFEETYGELDALGMASGLTVEVIFAVGKTEQNLEALFTTARRSGAVLFLDEADSLLMARGEGRASRHDDSAVNTLLKLIERHDGVVLLATNLPDRLDRALERRLTYRLRFPFPEPAERAAIWRRLLPDTAPSDGPLDVERLGARFALAGGHIKNAVFKAAFRAASGDQPLTQARLEEAAAEELAALGQGRGHRPVGFGAAREGTA
jgi:hypothetical protein